MKKTIIFSLLISGLLVGGLSAQAQKTRTKAKTSQTAKKKTAKVSVAEFKDGDDLFKFYSNGKYDALNGSNKFDSGYYLIDNEAIIYASANFGRSWIAFGDTIYDLDGLEEEGAIDWNSLPNIIVSNGGDNLAKIMKPGVINFNPDSQTVKYNIDGKSGSFTLKQIPADYRSSLSWIKQP